MKVNEIRFLIEIDRTLHHAIKLQALQERMSMKDWIMKVAIEAMNAANDSSMMLAKRNLNNYGLTPKQEAPHDQ